MDTDKKETRGVQEHNTGSLGTDLDIDKKDAMEVQGETSTVTQTSTGKAAPEMDVRVDTAKEETMTKDRYGGLSGDMVETLDHLETKDSRMQWEMTSSTETRNITTSMKDIMTMDNTTNDMTVELEIKVARMDS